MNYWTENAWLSQDKKPLHTLVDCGYVKHAKARNNADKLLKLVGRRNMQLASFGRILVHIPPTKVPLLKRFKTITRPGSYSWTTHTFDRGGPQFKHEFCGTP